MIGVFDSGFGGLTILNELLKKLPKNNYLYLGDSARAPYGNKSQEVIYKYTKEAVDYLFKEGCELIIIACNTASSRSLRKIQQEYLPKKYKNKKVLGVVIPVVEEAVELLHKQANIGVIGTSATIKSNVYEKEIKKRTNKLRVISQSTPLLVPLIESGWEKNQETKTILKKYLYPLKEKKIKSLILGCTHYPFLERDIKKILGQNIKIISTPKAVAKKLVDYLERHPEINKKIKKNSKIKFCTTDNPDQFKKLGNKFLKDKIDQVNKIEL